MKLLQEAEDATNERKFIKSQVEKRRRERMNRSLECLRTMLLQEPQQQDGTQRRVEKAEILEHTVLFLQNTVKGDRTSAAAAGDGGGQKHSFQDGFSTCLQTAAQFLGPEGKGLWLGAALDASLAASFSRSDSDSAGVRRRPEARFSSSSSSSSTTTSSSSSSLQTHTKSILRMLRQKSKHTQGSSVAHPYRLPAQQGSPTHSQQAQRQNQLQMRQVGKQSPSQSSPLSQTLWRPWP
ncbi:transcription factor HES-7.1-A-like [Centropristis striata]|uniref:transcription factor HES-7.1-A-like n=1 Tax=Centropristis striata TaxID=184440 RepID=UPI0027E02E63|nr:transcription factor HES-7.1-A-like [Centropristis striata]